MVREKEGLAPGVAPLDKGTSVRKKEKREGLAGINGGSESLVTPERAKVVGVRGIQGSDLPFIAHWAADPETHWHMDFAPEPPANWNSQEEVSQYIAKFAAYYRNIGIDPTSPDDPNNITPIVTVNSLNEPNSVSVIRWRGDPHVPKDRKIASLEGHIVDPKFRRKGIGKENLSARLDILFNIAKIYSGDPAREARLWIFTDEKAGNYQININFYRQFGFENLAGNWREYAAKRQIENVGDRDAMWFRLTREKWQSVLQEKPELAKHAPIDLLSLRL